MADKKISQLDVGGKLLPTDKVLIARDGQNYAVSGLDLTASVLPENGTVGQILRKAADGSLVWSKEADQVTGLPYRFSGPGKFQYWRVGIASQSSNYTDIREFALSRGPNGQMPPIVNRTLNWPVQWTDGNLDEIGRVFTFGTNVVETFDFGTAVTLDYLRVNLAYSFYSISVEYSSDQVNWSQAYSARPEAGGGGLPFTAALSVALDTYLTTYNLTADPTTNVGKVLKVNLDGTGFDFKVPFEGLPFNGVDYNLTASPTANQGKLIKVNADGTGFDFAAPLTGMSFDNVDYKLTASPTANQGKLVAVNAAGTGFEFVPVPTGGSGGGTSTPSNVTVVGGGTRVFKGAAELTSMAANAETTVTTLTFTGQAGAQRIISVNPYTTFASASGPGGANQMTWKLYRNDVEYLTWHTGAESVSATDKSPSFLIDADDLGAVSVTFRVTASYTQAVSTAFGATLGVVELLAAVAPAPASGKVKIYQDQKTISAIGTDETEAYSITFTPRAGSTIDVALGSIQASVISSPTAPGSGYSQIETRVYRNGVLLTNQVSRTSNTGLPGNGNITIENAGTDPITYRVTKVYARYDANENFTRYDALTGTFSYSYKIIEYP